MSARPIASGTISFGLVTIPIKLFASTDSAAKISFNQLHEKCKTRVRQQLICPNCDEVVPREDIVKGYQFAKDQYVLFDRQELDSLEVQATHSIDIQEFVPLDQVDPVFFQRSYFLGPDRNGDRPYKLLSQTLRETKRAAVGQYAARGKQYLVLVRPYDEGLIMEQLFYEDELRDFGEIPLGDVEVKDAELKLARQLVEQTSVDAFDPSQYEDQTRAQMLEMINQKIEGQEISAPPAAAPKAQIIDLMEALKASLSEEGKKERKPPKASPRKPDAKKEKKVGSKS